MLDTDEELSEYQRRWLQAAQGPSGGSIVERFAPLSAWYGQLTGFPNIHPNVIAHHKVVLYGPPCVDCDKPLRSPQAAFCADCGKPRAQVEAQAS